MKKFILNCLALSALLSGCSKIDSGITIYENPEFDVCLSPISVETSVKYDIVTLRCKVFQDASLYQMELYSYDMREEPEPDASKLEMSLEISPYSIPYQFKAPEEMNLFYRMRAVAEGKNPSKWVYGHFETGTDPSTICSKPTDAVAMAVFDKVTFSWTTYPDTEIYELEVYDRSIPDEGEPSADNLAASYDLTPSQIPFVATFPAGNSYYFRVRATAPSTDRRNSNWVKGSFSTTAFSWPEDPGALDYGLTGAWTATINSTKFPGYTSGMEIPEGGIVVDKVTYAYSLKYYGDRVQIPQCYNWDKTTYAVQMPDRRYISFRINRPGTLSFVPYASKTPSIVIALVVSKAGVKSASYAYRLENVTCYNKSGEKDDYRQYFEITENHLYGIDESATVYIFSDANGGFNCYPITWAPKSE